MKESFLDIVKARASPGILIFDTNNNLVYANEEAIQFLPGLRRRKVPPEILDLCQRVRSKTGRQVQVGSGPTCLIIDNATGLPFAVRAFPIKESGAEKRLTHVMVLVEKIVDQHLVDLDFDKIMNTFSLTRRETDVLRLISEGLSNKEIAKRLFVSEFTVKDHVKKIMDKMNLRSRSEIIASLLQPKKKES